MKKILLVISLLLFASVVKADLTGKQVLCESKQPNDLEKGGWVGFIFKSSSDVDILRFRYVDEYRVDKCSFCEGIKFNGVRFWEGSYDDKSEIEINIYDSKGPDKGFGAIKKINRETLSIKEESINLLDPLGPRDVEDLGTCQIVDYSLDKTFLDFSNQWTDYIEKQKQEQKSKNKL
jgi:hypothetical protein